MEQERPDCASENEHPEHQVYIPLDPAYDEAAGRADDALRRGPEQASPSYNQKDPRRAKGLPESIFYSYVSYNGEASCHEVELLKERLERNMKMFKTIFIEPEIQRIEGLKSKEKEFTNLVHNVINNQYDKLLEVNFKKIKGKDSSSIPQTAGVTNFTIAQRPASSVSKFNVHTK